MLSQNFERENPLSMWGAVTDDDFAAAPILQSPAGGDRARTAEGGARGSEEAAEVRGIEMEVRGVILRSGGGGRQPVQPDHPPDRLGEGGGGGRRGGPGEGGYTRIPPLSRRRPGVTTKISTAQSAH